MSDPALKLYHKAMGLLARREHSQKELAQKLSKHAEYELIDQVISQLIADNLQSDERYCEAFIRSKARKHYGPTKIRYELAQKGLSSSIIDEGMAQSGFDWQRIAQEWLDKRYTKTDLKDYDIRAKASRSLHQRGFNTISI